MVLRLVLAEDSFLMRDGISALLALTDDVDVVASCENYDSLLRSVATHQPDVVLTDIRMPPSQTDEGIRAADVIRADHPEIGVVVLSQYVEPEYARRLFEHGSERRAYLLKERVADLDELGGAIRRVADGGSVVDPKVVEALIGVNATQEFDALDRLTERERDVLAEMATGKSNSSIGEALFISARSVEKHISAIFAKLDLVQTEDAHRRVRAVLVFLGLGSAGRG
ncbi:MAG: response regulator [Ilumatobacter sp.]